MKVEVDGEDKNVGGGVGPKGVGGRKGRAAQGAAGEGKEMMRGKEGRERSGRAVKREWESFGGQSKGLGEVGGEGRGRNGVWEETGAGAKAADEKGGAGRLRKHGRGGAWEEGVICRGDEGRADGLLRALLKGDLMMANRPKRVIPRT